MTLCPATVPGSTVFAAVSGGAVPVAVSGNTVFAAVSGDAVSGECFE